MEFKSVKSCIKMYKLGGNCISILAVVLQFPVLDTKYKKLFVDCVHIVIMLINHAALDTLTYCIAVTFSSYMY